MRSEATGPTISLERDLPATPSRVFELLCRPESIPKWLGPSDEFRVTAHEWDCRPGGRYRVEFNAPDGETNVVVGEFLGVAFIFNFVANNFLNKILNRNDANYFFISFYDHDMFFGGYKFTEHRIKCRHRSDCFSFMRLQLIKSVLPFVKINIYEILQYKKTPTFCKFFVEDRYSRIVIFFQFINFLSIDNIPLKQVVGVLYRGHNFVYSFFAELERALYDFHLIIIKLTVFA